MSNGYKTNCTECGSSDGNHIYPDGHSYCYVCNVRKDINNQQPVLKVNNSKVNEIYNYRNHKIAYRNITPEIYNRFEVRTNRNSQYYPYTDNKGNTVAYKERQCIEKKFFIHGDFSSVQLFGQSLFPPGGKMLVITEGELDAMSIAEVWRKPYPVVSIPSASNLKVLLNQRDWVRSFSEVILWFDNDEAGKKATEQAAKIIGYDKVKIVENTGKDANELLLSGDTQIISDSIWRAQRYSPAGLLTNGSIWDKYEEYKLIESIPYPECIAGINDKVKGMRQGEITLFTSGTGSGKSTVIKEIIYDLIKCNDKKVGLVSLEESIHDTVSKFLAMNYQDQDITKEMFQNLVLLDHQGSVGDSSLVDQIEIMALMGCTHIILDHITIAVSEGTEGLEGNAAIDKIMSDLLKIVKKHNIWLGLVSHLRKAFGGKSFEEGKHASIDDIKGSGSIKQISFDIIAFARNLVADDEAERNIIKFRVLKSRFTGLTGDAGSAAYDSKTSRLKSTGGFNATI